MRPPPLFQNHRGFSSFFRQIDLHELYITLGSGLTGLIRALRRRWKLAVLGGLICSSLAAAAVYFFLPPSNYTTSALVFVAASRPKEIFDTRESNIAYATYQETQVTLAKSRKVIESALKQDAVTKLASVRKQEDPIDWLSNQIKVDFPRGSEILRISVTGGLPAERPRDVGQRGHRSLHGRDRRAGEPRTHRATRTIARPLRHAVEWCCRTPATAPAGFAGNP